MSTTTAGPDSWEDIDVDDVELKDKIGGGGFALVYKGRWRSQDVAVKTMFDPKVDEKMKRDYLDELHTMRALKHPNIVEFLGACTKPPKMCFVMELCHQSLFNLLHETSAQLKPKHLITWAIDVVSAFVYLHGRSPPVIHRDLKSHNLLLARDGRLKLCDFGLVSTRAVTAGTPHYMAPELLGGGVYSKKVDVYAFGVLLWEMFAREVPYIGWRAADIKDHVIKGGRLDFPSGHGWPPLVVSLVKQCWSQDPDERPDFAAILPQLQGWKPTRTAVARLSTAGRGGGDALDALMG
jgi:serine/threonine protein kinase